jgi:hypothetical protein
LPGTAGKLAFFRAEGPAKISQRTLTFQERVSYQRAIEEVYWRHRIWPKERLDPKPSLDAVMSQPQLEKEVTDYLRDFRALEDYWQRPIIAERLQSEMDRMATHTKQPEVLGELFAALDNDPFVIAECLERPALTKRNLATAKSRRGLGETQLVKLMSAASARYTLPTISGGAGCLADTWTAMSVQPAGRSHHIAVWTGSEMIVWGGYDGLQPLRTGARYNPSTDTWTTISTIGVPTERYYHTAVWTGSEMIVWGGLTAVSYANSGGRYNPTIRQLVEYKPYEHA